MVCSVRDLHTMIDHQMNTQIHRSNTRFLCDWLIVDNLVVVFVSTLFFFFSDNKTMANVRLLYFFTLLCHTKWFTVRCLFCRALLILFNCFFFNHLNFSTSEFSRTTFFLSCVLLCFCRFFFFFSTLCCLSFNFYWFKCVTLFFRIVLFCQFVCTCVLFVRRFVHTQILFRLLFWFNNNLLAVAVARIATILFLSQYLYWRTRWATATNWLRTFFIRSLVYLPSVVFFHQYHQKYHHTDISIHNKFNYDVFT